MNVDKMLSPEVGPRLGGEDQTDGRRSAFVPYVKPQYWPSGQEQQFFAQLFANFALAICGGGGGGNNESNNVADLASKFVETKRRPGECAKKATKSADARKPRTTFSAFQTECLELEYVSNEYLSRAKRIKIAQQLNLHESQVKIWFQNRRAKDKRIDKARKCQDGRSIPTKSPAGTSFLAPCGISDDLEMNELDQSSCDISSQFKAPVELVQPTIPI